MAAPVMSFRVNHGEHPDRTLWRHGWVVLHPLRAELAADGDIQIMMLVRPRRRGDRPQPHRPRARDANLELEPGERPVIRQRAAAYALVASERGILGTVCSPRTNAPGAWMLPGGGIDDGESPAEAVVREIFEEAGQRVHLQRLLMVQSDHWVGRAPSGVVEDFHALRIIYAATCEHPTDPVVHDVDGTTDHAAWVRVDDWRRKPWTAGARALLSAHAPRLMAS